MRLDDYITEQGLSRAAFAAKLGMSEASLSRICRGAQNITSATMRSIGELTRGAVTPNDLVEINHVAGPTRAEQLFETGKSEVSTAQGAAA